jgi:hypothetical protein
MLFFGSLQIPRSKEMRVYFYQVAIAVILINFIFLTPFTKISSTIFTIEGVILILYSILFFLNYLKSEELISGFDASLYVVTGLVIYESVCFPIFLFYDTLIEQTKDYAVSIWDVHNIVYIVFCLFIARAFYGSSRYTVT